MMDHCIQDFTAINTPPRHHLESVSVFRVDKAIFNHEALAPTASHGNPLDTAVD
jgi:hypothetical protein